ncbi:hypothetical protein AG74_100 [Vibrio phage AG74]|uniref:Uncharacterized protein n=1 Tax=Vibrio phage AG74 TaxID=2736261 RepID=A0A6M9Z159_9CAUD|nr:hypothetical protein KNV06_gp190 [Vibrio phage AG74]QKN84953.1 hypothetical protein AG74_100 [Vibrio phage AG74]
MRNGDNKLNKLGRLKEAVKEIRNDTVNNLLTKLINAGDMRQALYFTAGCLMYIEHDNSDRVHLEYIRDILL